MKDAYQINVTDSSLPDWFKTVTGPTARLLAEDGAVLAEFDTSEMWWRVDFAEARGKVWLASLREG